MATLTSLTASSQTVPSTLTATFSVAGGTPAVTANVTVLLDGVVKGTASNIQVAPAVPGESTPVVSLGNTNSGWEIRTTAGVLRGGSVQNQFVLSAS